MPHHFAQVGIDDGARSRSSDSMLIAALTSLSGRWVVASATRMPVGRQHHDGHAAHAVRAARYSVWPVNGTPASLMTPLCTGAVTMRGELAAAARRRWRDRAARARSVRCADRAGRRCWDAITARCSTLSVPGSCGPAVCPMGAGGISVIRAQHDVACRAAARARRAGRDRRGRRARTAAAGAAIGETQLRPDAGRLTRSQRDAR